LTLDDEDRICIVSKNLDFFEKLSTKENRDDCYTNQARNNAIKELTYIGQIQASASIKTVSLVCQVAGAKLKNLVCKLTDGIPENNAVIKFLKKQVESALAKPTNTGDLPNIVVADIAEVVYEFAVNKNPDCGELVKCLNKYEPCVGTDYPCKALADEDSKRSVSQVIKLLQVKNDLAIVNENLRKALEKEKLIEKDLAEMEQQEKIAKDNNKLQKEKNIAEDLKNKKILQEHEDIKSQIENERERLQDENDKKQQIESSIHEERHEIEKKRRNEERHRDNIQHHLKEKTTKAGYFTAGLAIIGAAAGVVTGGVGTAVVYGASAIVGGCIGAVAGYYKKSSDFDLEGSKRRIKQAKAEVQELDRKLRNLEREKIKGLKARNEIKKKLQNCKGMQAKDVKMLEEAKAKADKLIEDCEKSMSDIRIKLQQKKLEKQKIEGDISRYNAQQKMFAAMGESIKKSNAAYNLKADDDERIAEEALKQKTAGKGVGRSFYSFLTSS